LLVVLLPLMGSRNYWTVISVTRSCLNCVLVFVEQPAHHSQAVPQPKLTTEAGEKAGRPARNGMRRENGRKGGETGGVTDAPFVGRKMAERRLAACLQ